MTRQQKIKAAVYTRVSTDHSLDNDFNSLHAQREAGEAYIKSQKSEGWVLATEAYDDAGISGGTLQRPALQKLLKDIEEQKVNIIVVYKVDRLSRSLADFAQIIERIEAAGASFVSVTQHFNTSNSMGRLTLNILLSFAQFEREVTAERIKDKIDASKKKGIWMGGPIPLGYKSHNKKLVIHDMEAKTVQAIFETYLQCPSVDELKHAINALGLKPKVSPAKPFTKSALNYILKNEIYIGRIPHKGNNYKGEHKALIAPELWEAVQKKLKAGQAPRKHRTNSGYPSLLTGLLYDDSDNKLSPSHTNKKGTRYRYYITKELYERKEVRRYSAPLLEDTVKGALFQILTKRANAPEPNADGIQNLIWAQTLKSGTPLEQQDLIGKLIRKVVVRSSTITIALTPSLNHHQAQISASLVKMPVSADCTKGINYNDKLFTLIANAHIWLNDLKSGDFKTIEELALYHKVDKSDMSRNIRLAFLAPDIITAICEGTQPASLKPTYLRRLKYIPENWDEQKKLLGVQ